MYVFGCKFSVAASREMRSESMSEKKIRRSSPVHMDVPTMSTYSLNSQEQLEIALQDLIQQTGTRRGNLGERKESEIE